MNLKMRNWYLPQWITNILLIFFLITLYNSSYALFGSMKYGGVTIFTIISTPIILYGHLHNFGLQADITLEDFAFRIMPGLAIILTEIFFSIVAALIFRRLIYWKEILVVVFTMVLYLVSSFHCFNKIETKTVTYDELEKMME